MNKNSSSPEKTPLCVPTSKPPLRDDSSSVLTESYTRQISDRARQISDIPRTPAPEKGVDLTTDRDRQTNPDLPQNLYQQATSRSKLTAPKTGFEGLGLEITEIDQGDDDTIDIPGVARDNLSPTDRVPNQDSLLAKIYKLIF